MQNYTEMMQVLHTVYKNTLVKTDPIMIPTITTPLWSHQSTLIQAMHNYRQKLTYGLQLDDYELKSKIGILGDPSGSGKTLAMLGYLVMDTEQYPMTELSPYSSPYFYTERRKYPENPINLIIVPTHLFHYWQDEIKKHTTIKHVPIETKGKLKDDQLQTILASTFILTTNKCFRAVQEYATRHHITWNNVCIDEPLFIQMKSSDPKLEFQFLWLMTYQWTSLIFRSPVKKSQLLFLKESMHADLEEMLLDNCTEEIHLYPTQYMKQYVEYNHSHRGYLILRNSNEHIRNTLHYPQIQHSIVQCKSTTTLQALSSIYLSRNRTFTSSAIPHIFQALSIESVEVEQYVAQHESKRDLIQRKITENECGICLESCAYPTIVNCCYQVYCGKCILQNTIIQYKCPTCRNMLDVSRMRCLTLIGATALQTKKEACLTRISSLKPCVIYIALDKIYHDLVHEMVNLGITAELLSSHSLRKTIKNFREGITKVLFVSKIELIRGLSLPTSSLLFYHEQPVFELKQALINMVQQVRKEPLQILYLHSEVPV